jgi:hypothetical protein
MEPKCPYCKGGMSPGRVSIHGRLLDFLAVGTSSQQLWFAPDSNPQREEQVLASWGHDASEGHRCTNCGAVLIKGETHITQSEARQNEETLRQL